MNQQVNEQDNQMVKSEISNIIIQSDITNTTVIDDETLLLMLADKYILENNYKQLKKYIEHVKTVINDMSNEIKTWIEKTIVYNTYLVNKHTLLSADTNKKYEKYINSIQEKIKETEKILTERSNILTFLSKNKNKILSIDNDFFELNKLMKRGKPVDILRKQLEMDEKVHHLFMCNYNLHKEVHQL